MSDLLNCPVAACPNMRSRSHLTCRGHWHQLRRQAPGLANAVLAEYRAWAGPMQTREYFEARERALAFLDGREPDMERVDRLLEPAGMEEGEPAA